MQLSQSIEEFVKDVCAGKTNYTPKSYRNKLNHYLLSFMSDVELSTISEEDLDNLCFDMLTRNKKKRGKKVVKGQLSKYTIRSVLSTVRHFFRWAYESKLIEHNPAIDLNIPTPPPPDPKAIRTKTVNELLATAATTGIRKLRARNIAIIYLFRDSGGRLGGIAQADIDNLDLERRRLEITGKGKKINVLRFAKTTADALREWLLARRLLNPLDNKLFISEHGTGLASSTYNSILRNLAVRAAVSGRYNPHSFRHGFARDTLRAGADLSQVSQLLHHSSIVVTADYYARWADEELQEIHSQYSPGNSMPIVSPQ